MKSFIFRIVSVLVAAFLLTACAHSYIHLVKTWKSPETKPAKFGKFLIVGASDNLERRWNFEDFFTEEFKHQGIAAIPSYMVIRTGDALSRQHLKDAARISGADGVLITRLVNIKKEIKEVPGGETLVFKPFTPYPLPNVDDISSANIPMVGTVIQEPPTIITNLEVSIETRLFDAATSSMVWYGVTSSGEVDDLKKATEAFAREIIKALAKDGMI